MVEEVKDVVIAAGAPGVKTSGEISSSVFMGGFGKSPRNAVVKESVKSPASSSCPKGEDDRRRSNAKFNWSRNLKCVGVEVESEGETARQSELELLVLSDTDCRRLLHHIVYNQHPQGWRRIHFGWGGRGRRASVVVAVGILCWHASELLAVE